MMKLRTLLQGAALAALASGSALAADLPRRTAPPAAPIYAPPVFTWTGFYVGLNAGVAIDASQYQFSPFFASGNSGAVGFTGGGQLGYNWQTGPLVVGLETDLNYRSSQNNSGGGFGMGAVGSGAGYFGTLRGRVGFTPMDRMMIYATGGLAYGNTNFPGSVAGIDGFGGAHALYGGGNAGTSVGWTVGGGAEYALNRNWSIKAEYLYVSLGGKSTNYIDAVSGLPIVANANTRDHIARVGVNYHF